MKKSITSFIFLWIIISSPALAQNNASDIQQEINTVQKNIAQEQVARQALQKKLKASEEYLGELKIHNDKTKTTLKKEAEHLNVLQKKQVEYEKKFLAQQEEIAVQVRAIYTSRNNEFLKMLLTQKDPKEIQRNLIYYNYFFKKRLELVHALQQTIKTLQENAQEIRTNTHVLMELQKQQQVEINQIQDTQFQRNQVLEKIDTTISSRTTQLAELEQNRKALEKVVVNLDVKTKSASPQHHHSVHGTFSKNKGKMSWPAQGKISEGFDSNIEGSHLKLNGVLISAPLGEKVYAIAPGRVVFSQWMSGYGLLVIVDHGSGYMTLYGRNDAVYKKVGDKIATGDLLATVGTSGGYKKSALYFAIRENGKPVNPALWCRG